MSQVLRIVGLEEDGLFGSAVLKSYNGLASHSHKRNYLARIVRNGYAVDEMGLSTLIELIQTTDGKKFMKMNQRDRMKRLLSLINVVMCEDVPELPESDVQPAPAPVVKAAPAAAEPPAAAPVSQPEPVATVSEPEPEPDPVPPAEPVAEASNPEEKTSASVAPDADSEGEAKVFGATRKKSGKGRSLINPAGAKS